MVDRGLWRSVMLIAFLIVACGEAMPADAQGVDEADDLNHRMYRLYQAGKYQEAAEVEERELVLREHLGPDDPGVALALNNLANIYRALGRYAEAEPMFKRSLTIREKAFGSDHPFVAVTLNNLALMYTTQGRYAEAEPMFKRSLAIEERLGTDQANLGVTLNNLALVYLDEGRYAEAEPLFQRGLAVREKALGPNHPDVAQTLSNLAVLYVDQGRYADAEPMYQRSLAIRERAEGTDHPDVAVTLVNLAALYRLQARYTDAEPLYRRGLAIRERALGPDHPDVAAALEGLGIVYDNTGRYGDAEPLFKRGLAIYEKAFGADHRLVASALVNIGDVYRHQKRFADAEPLFTRSLAINEKALGRDHPDVATDLDNLAVLYREQGRDVEAEQSYLRCLAIREKALAADHPYISYTLNNLAVLYFERQDWARAREFWRRSTDSTIRRVERGTQAVGTPTTGNTKSEAEQSGDQFWELVKTGHRIAAENGDLDGALAREMFQVAQWALTSSAAQSLAQMAVRSAAGDPGLAALVRERQDLVAEWQGRDGRRNATLAQAADQRDHRAEAANAARMAAIDTRIGAIDKRLAANFPDFASLASPRPLSVEDVQARLRADEALVLFLNTPSTKPIPEETFIWVVTRSDMQWVRSELGTGALAREVAALRCGLDYEGPWISTRCIDLFKGRYSAINRAFGDPLPFDLQRAHVLYTALFGQVEDLIKDKQLLIVPSGPLTQLPFHALVTEPPAAAQAASLADYRKVAWFVRKHAVTVLPAVSSFKALRDFAKSSHASEAFVGFGDPLLQGGPIEGDAAARAKAVGCASRLKQGPASAARRSVDAVAPNRSGLADVALIRAQHPLPETADELCQAAQTLGVDPSLHVHIGTEATETKVKQLSADGTLAKYRIIAFATHGVLAGQIAREPGLILTPPDQATDLDDGFLSSSEIAPLKLDADWVILSACNTAAGGVAGGEVLSGLARAFFYAGARSLLVSHWVVYSIPAVKLITKAVGELTADPRIGRAEAMRRSMLAMITSGSDLEAHPALWAPFVLVGEGGAMP